MKFSVLGPLAVRDGTGRQITPRPLKLRALLALLLLNADRTVVADRLVDQLWDGVPPRTARTALQVYVSRLRAHFAVHCDEQQARRLLVTEPSGYALALDGHLLDLHMFQGLTARAHDLEAAGDPAAACEALKAALAAWTGPALDDVRSVAALGVSALQLDEARGAALEHQIGLNLQLARHVDAIGALTELIARHPLRERLHGHLMLAQYRSGRTADSLDTYQRLRGAMVAELGLEPSERLQLLHQSILRRDPRLDRDPLAFAA